MHPAKRTIRKAPENNFTNIFIFLPHYPAVGPLKTTANMINPDAIISRYAINANTPLKNPFNLYRLKYNDTRERNINPIPAKDMYIFINAGDNSTIPLFPDSIISYSLNKLAEIYSYSENYISQTLKKPEKGGALFSRLYD